MERALASRRFGPYTLQAAIAAVHAEAPSAAATDWGEIVGLYDVLLRAEPSPVVELNRAVAVAMRDGPGGRPRARSTPSWRAAICRTTTWRTRRGRICAGGWAGRRKRAPPTQRALALTRQEPERRFLERRLAELPLNYRARITGSAGCVDFGASPFD